MALLKENKESSDSIEPCGAAGLGARIGFVMRVHGGQHDGRLVQVTTDRCTVGRSAKCTLRLVSPEFQPLHCLLVRGQGGVVVRCWSEETTLNGETFTVSWMEPGDRLGVGPIELELIEPSKDSPECDERESGDRSDEPANASEQLLPRNAEREVRLADELANAQQLLAQLLEERQELIERLESLNTEKPNVGGVPALEYDRASELTERCQTLERELERALEDRRQLNVEVQQAHEQRGKLESIVDELREEVEGVIQLRNDWYHERDQLRHLLEEAIDHGYVPVQGAETGDASNNDPVSGKEPPAIDLGEQSDASHSDESVTCEGVGEVDLERPAPTGELSTDAHEERLRHFTEMTQHAEDASESAVDLPMDEAASESSALPSDQPTIPSPTFSRTYATEPNIDLSAMREVANETARVAIDKHAHRRGLDQALYQWTMGLCALMMAGIVSQIAASDAVINHCIVGACLVIAIWWLSVGAVKYRETIAVNSDRLRKAAESLNARMAAEPMNQRK